MFAVCYLQAQLSVKVLSHNGLPSGCLWYYGKNWVCISKQLFVDVNEAFCFPLNNYSLSVTRNVRTEYGMLNIEDKDLDKQTFLYFEQLVLHSSLPYFFDVGK